jgi:pilus assembly protein TadC
LIDFVPVIFEKNQIGFQIIRQELKGLSFPNSLFKNNAYKLINRLANDFKYDLLKSPELLSNFSGPLVLNNANLIIDALQWNESAFYVSGILGADWKISK